MYIYVLYICMYTNIYHTWHLLISEGIMGVSMVIWIISLNNAVATNSTVTRCRHTLGTADCFIATPCSIHVYASLRHTATHCNTLQHTATHSNTLQHTATHCNTLQHTAHTLQLTPKSWALECTTAIHLEQTVSKVGSIKIIGLFCKRAL